MSKKSLIALSICLVMAAGIALYVWADTCCSGDALCDGQRTGEIDTCNFHFSVYHDKVDPDHVVYLWIKSSLEDEYTAFMLSIHSDPTPICTRYVTTLELDPRTRYYYYFACANCPSSDPDEGYYDFNTGNCDE